MGVRRLKLFTLLGYGVMGIGGLWIGLSERAIASFTMHPPAGNSQNSQDAQKGTQVAQSLGSSCRQTNATTGVYEQPNLDSASRGILTTAQTVRLELLGTGTGWARINQPLVGWIEARYLTPDVPCGDLESPQANPQNVPQMNPPTRSQTAAHSSPTASNPTASNPTASRSAQTTDRSTPTSTLGEAERRSHPSDNSFPSPTLSSPRSNPATGGVQSSIQAPSIQAPNARTSGTPSPSTRASGTQIITLSCDVLPSEGLIVRRAPTLVGDTYITTLPAGTYQFQFTRNTQTNETPEGTRRWVYITAPVEGWISLGYVGKDFNLGGRECG